ncbi:hypothetical protein CLV29_2251 [Naumannella halotolerans]|uniref:Transcription elongation GreA/GreB family factor n=2 Tax=Naumannella halotolerans TaxID=993414 RepID=A0A4R7J1F7_9ACTN|nr:hypothetical protein CLV29_2251 [Naumannella halotolerans]
MSETTMDAAAKQRVREALLAQLQAQLEASQESIAVETEGAQIDEEDDHREDDTAQSYEYGDKAGVLEEFAAGQEQRAETAEDLDFSLTDVVRPGAIVGFDGNRYIAGVVSDAFDVDGITYEGISADAPAYQALEGKHLGDGFSIGDRGHTIDFLA